MSPEMKEILHENRKKHYEDLVFDFVEQSKKELEYTIKRFEEED
jgi:hypothetical protein